YTVSEPFAAVFSSAISFFLPSMTSYTGVKSLSTSTDRFFLGRSLTWPREALTTKSLPRYLPMVFAFAGDSTMTRFFAIDELRQLSFRTDLRYTAPIHKFGRKQPKSYHVTAEGHGVSRNSNQPRPL